MSQPANGRVNPVFKAMNRPLTVLGAERRLFFVALISGGAIFSLLHSLLGGIGLFIVGVIIARIATKHDVEILRVLFNSSKFRRRYDPMKPLHGADALTCVHWPSRWSGETLNDDQIRIVRRDVQG
jgi:type IV secretory pathway TrbD component